MTAKNPIVQLSRAELVSLSNDIRLACMRISRRVRFESDRELPPHQFSVLCRLEATARTNSELADIERDTILTAVQAKEYGIVDEVISNRKLVDS